jgi:hypothetical protein
METFTEEQKKLRTGIFTGSEIYKLMGAKGLGKTGETYVYEKVAEYLTGLPCKEEFSAASTNWGKEYEPEAKLHFEAATGQKILPATTISNGFISGTPDGLLVDCGFEIKCPFNSGNHLKNLLMSNEQDLLDLRPEYYWQILSYMWLTRLNSWKFCSYDPRFKEEKRMLILNVKLHELNLELMKNRVTEAKLMFENILSKLEK